MRGLQGKVILLAGGGGGIGTATSVRLASEGARVAVADINAANAEEVVSSITDDGGEGIALPLDIGDDSSVTSAVEATVGHFGRLDGIHINAADLSPNTIQHDTDAVDIDLDVFDRTLRTNLRGHLLATRHALPHLLSAGGGAIVYTSSAAAFIGEPQRPGYGVAKSGINALMRHVASRWGREGIRANAVAPGLVLTETVQQGVDDSFRQYALKGTRSARLGKPSDIAAMVTFLLSDDAEWINGQVISVDGGATLR